MFCRYKSFDGNITISGNFVLTAKDSNEDNQLFRNLEVYILRYLIYYHPQTKFEPRQCFYLRLSFSSQSGGLRMGGSASGGCGSASGGGSVSRVCLPTGGSASEEGGWTGPCLPESEKRAVFLLMVVITLRSCQCSLPEIANMGVN